MTPWLPPEATVGARSVGAYAIDSGDAAAAVAEAVARMPATSREPQGDRPLTQIDPSAGRRERPER